MSPILDDLRSAIESSAKTRYQIAKETGVSESQLAQFMAGRKGLGFDALERVADSLGLEVALRRKRRRTKGR